jgi:hypothetical protein
MLQAYISSMTLMRAYVIIALYEPQQEPLSDLLTKTATMARKESTGNSQPISRKLSRQSSTASTASAASTASKAAATAGAKKATSGSSVQHSNSVQQPLLAVKSEPHSQPAVTTAVAAVPVQAKKKKKSRLNSLDSDSDSD